MSAGTPSAPKRKVLVVDDDAASRRIIVLSLQKLGHVTFEADDGAAALPIIEREHPEVVLTDWMMPGLDGLDLSRRIRARPPTAGAPYVYVIVLTGRSERADLLEALSAGADAFLTKPVDLADLQVHMVTAERLLGLQTRLVEAERLAAAGALAVSIRHEINNPLAGMCALLDLGLGNGAKLPKEVEADVETLRGLARRIATIVGKLQGLQSVPLKTYLGPAGGASSGAVDMVDLDGAARGPPT